MKAGQYLGFAVAGMLMLGTGSVLADDFPLPPDLAQQREKMRSMSAEDRSAYRDQMQERVRNMTPEEQKLMRETRSDGRARLEGGQTEGTPKRSRDGGAQGGGYGQGYESRRGGALGGGGRGR